MPVAHESTLRLSDNKKERIFMPAIESRAEKYTKRLDLSQDLSQISFEKPTPISTSNLNQTQPVFEPHSSLSKPMYALN